KRLDADGIIPYDFTMNPEDHGQIFCAELVQIAFELATDNTLHLPKYQSSFAKLINTQFMKELGVSRVNSFAPGDIEVESSFSPVAEYRYFPALRKIKIQDAILSSMFNWMKKYNYEFAPNPKAYVLSELAWIARQLGFAENKMQKHMRPQALGLLIKFQDVTKVLEKTFFKYDEEFFKTNGHYLTYADLLKVMDTYRREDCETFSQPSSPYDDSKIESKFHKYFRPKSGSCF
ncbi:MAG: hypothetical protein K2Q18_10830, partial [Bdellovibrionales bacterium]|nr:hypothetical protein [Bdellovibrionales bacterium]